MTRRRGWLVLVVVLASAGAAAVAIGRGGDGRSGPGTRTVTLTYDVANDYVDGSYDTTVAADRYVTTVGGRGVVPWGEQTMTADPSGGVGTSARDDPPGTTYRLTVTWFDAAHHETARVVKQARKP